MDLFLNSSWESQLIKHFVQYTQLSSYVNVISLSKNTLSQIQQGKISLNVPSLVVNENTYLTSPVSICLHLSKISGTKSFLFGTSTSDETSVVSYVENAKNSSNMVKDFNSDLATKTYFLQGHITFADLYIFFGSYASVLGLSNDEKWEFCHFFRWFNHIQNLPNISEFLVQNNMPKASFPVKQTVNSDQNKKVKKEKVIGTHAPVKDEEKEKKKKEQQLKNQQKLQQQKQQKEKQKKEASQPELSPEDPMFFEQNIDIRVGELKKVWKHPESDKLWCEEIDVGEEKPRQIASGLQQIVPLEQMTGKVLVFANLKSRTLAGFPSQGMVLCSSTADKSQTAILRPPKDAKIGERVVLEGLADKFKQEPLAVINPKKKILERALPLFKCDENCVANYNGIKWVVSGGNCSTESIANGIVA